MSTPLPQVNPKPPPLALQLIVRQAACQFGMTPKQAKAEFVRRFGIDVAVYAMQRRVAEGLALIRAGMKVDSAASEVGFKKGKRHFYAAVRKMTGTTPALHRRRQRDREREKAGDDI